MNEKLLQFIWQYSLFQPNIVTIQGDKLSIIHPGRLNTDAGPDFSHARIQIGNTQLVGNIELHVFSSDWDKHQHQNSESYQNIILHVVFQHDTVTTLPHCPTIELKNFIDPKVINEYKNLISAKVKIPCQSQLQHVRNITRESWLTSLLAQRWEQKLSDWEELLQQSKGDWSTLFYWRLAASFGFKVNATPFLLLAQSIPIQLLAKHQINQLQIEALLFGQAGFLQQDFRDEYPNQLKKEYTFLQSKYQLKPIPNHLWKFLRMRPSNFPTIRIAQFATLIHESTNLFSLLLDTIEYEKIVQLFEVTAHEYWNNHFRFDEISSQKSSKKLGRSSIDSLVINTIAPIKFLYAQHQAGIELQEQAMQLLESVKPEQNHIIDYWNEAKWKPQNAMQSQALIQLYNEYCDKKQCLKCAIGLQILKT